MLARLEVANLAILEHVALEFGPGLNVLTGETGAGKSLLLDALQLALGSRATPELIRSGARSLRVDALFEIPAGSALEVRLEELGAAAEDGGLLLSRELAVGGRGACRLNGRLVTAAQLRQVGGELLALLGQGEYHRLAQPAAQLEYLDAYAGLGAERAAVAAAYARWRQATAEFGALGGDGAERTRRRDLLLHAVEEIEALDLAPDEEERISERRRVLGQAERLLEAARLGLDALRESEGAVQDRLGTVEGELGWAARVDPRLGEAYALTQEARVAVTEAARLLADYAENAGLDPAELQAVERRWEQIQRCKQRYGDSVPAVLAHLARCRAELEGLEEGEGRRARLAQEVAALSQTLGQAADLLGTRRQEAARRLEAEVGQVLGELGMPGASLAVRFERRVATDGVPVGSETLACGPAGCEEVSLLWGANQGEPALPLGRAASGGELSRLLLALYTLGREAQEVGTLVFDEVDAGLGGRAAVRVAQRLQLLARQRQVLCVTHLAVVAASASRHFNVLKEETLGRTSARVLELEGGARIAEVARMLDGAGGASALRHAQEMLSHMAAGG